MLCDLPGVLSFLGLPPETEMPPGNKGKTKLKKLYRKVAPNKAYHSGERAKDLISHLDMAEMPRHRGALFSAAGALHSNDKRRLTQAPASVDKTTGMGASLYSQPLYSQPFHTSGS